MKRLFAPIVFAIAFLTFCSTAFASTWYVRADGGTRYSSNASQGQCDGLGDAAYPGTGVNQHCAFSDVRYLWDDQRSWNQLQWVIAGGDTVIIDNTKQWRIGWDGDGTNMSSEPWCSGWSAGPYGCFNPQIPAGTPAQHTRILGRNYASCNVGNQPDKSKMTQIFGGHGIWEALYLGGAQYVDVQCIEITRHSQCVVHGSPALPSGCSSSIPIDDYDGDGIVTTTGTHDVLLQDMWIHGHTDRGIIGPVGGAITANRIDIDTNGMAGWDFDDGNSTPSVNGSLNMTNSTIEWSGCNQEYPATHAIPVTSCYSQSTGGYGDGIGTPAGTGLNIVMDHDVFRYNTQDGEDFGHVDTGSWNLTITNSASYANNGGQFKWGPAFSNVLFENNIAVGNCLRMSQPIPGAPDSYNANLSDFCRAFDALSFVSYNGTQALFANNTVISYSPTTVDMQCGTYNGVQNCANAKYTFVNNIFRGYDNPTTYNMGGQSGGPGGFCGAGCNGSTALIGTINRSGNIFYGLRGSCIANQPSYSQQGTAIDESCVDPSFVNEPSAFINEASLDSLNFALAQGSPAVYAAAVVSGVPTDFDGATRQSLTSLGALEYQSEASLATIATSTLDVSDPVTVMPVTPLAPVTTPVTVPIVTTPVATTPVTTTPVTTTPVTTTPVTTTPVTTTPVTKKPKTPAPAPAPSPVATVVTVSGQKYKTLTQAVTVSATVSGVTSTKKSKLYPTGTATLFMAGMQLGTVTLNGTGEASWQVTGTVENWGVTIRYNGDSNFAPSTSALLTINPK